SLLSNHFSFPTRRSSDLGLRFANCVLILGLLFSLAWLVYVILSHKPHLHQKLIPAGTAVCCLVLLKLNPAVRLIASLVIAGICGDRKSTRLNSSHLGISY